MAGRWSVICTGSFWYGLRRIPEQQDFRSARFPFLNFKRVWSEKGMSFRHSSKYHAEDGGRACTLHERYTDLLQTGVLKDDTRQAAAVQRLSHLRTQLVEYRAQVDAYSQELDDYNERRNLLLKQLEARDEVAKQQHQRAGQSSQPISSSSSVQLPAKASGLVRSFVQSAFRNPFVLSKPEMVREETPSAAAEMETPKQADARRFAEASALLPAPPSKASPPRGVFLHGSVGAGKSMLMDLFYDSCEGVLERRRRMHFNAAMLEVHSRLHTLWKRQKVEEKEEKLSFLKSAKLAIMAARRRKRHGASAQETCMDFSVSGIGNSKALGEVAAALVGGSCWGTSPSRVGPALVCFDEFQVTDAFTAITLKAVFERLLAEGVVIVATANREPKELNRSGEIRSDVFKPFAENLAEWCEPYALHDGVDYRRQAIAATSTLPSYFFPLNHKTKCSFEQKFVDACGYAIEDPQVRPQQLAVRFNRNMVVPRACNGVAHFTFEELCMQPLWAPDYIALAEAYHTVFLSDIPAMSRHTRDQARRFITLVDELYNARRCLVCSAEVSPDDLFSGAAEVEEPSLMMLESLQFETAPEGGRMRRNVLADGGVSPLGESDQQMRGVQTQLSGKEEEFAIKRAISRILEMQSPSYLRARPRVHA